MQERETSQGLLTAIDVDNLFLSLFTLNEAVVRG